MKIKQTASTLFLIAMLCLGATKAKAQVNAQLFYDFGSDREFVTLTLEMFKQDKWGNTYFFIDHDFNYDQHVKGPNLAPGGTYFEIARCLNFWQNSAIKNLSLQVEYNGGITASYPINNAWLVGLDYFIHSKDFKNTLNLKALYKNIQKKDSDVPMQFTVVWAMNDLFGVKGLKFDGFADFWWEDHAVDFDANALATRRAPCSSPSRSSGITWVSTSVAITSASVQRSSFLITSDLPAVSSVARASA